MLVKKKICGKTYVSFARNLKESSEVLLVMCVAFERAYLLFERTNWLTKSHTTLATILTERFVICYQAWGKPYLRLIKILTFLTVNLIWAVVPERIATLVLTLIHIGIPMSQPTRSSPSLYGRNLSQMVCYKLVSLSTPHSRNITGKLLWSIRRFVAISCTPITLSIVRT